MNMKTIGLCLLLIISLRVGLLAQIAPADTAWVPFEASYGIGEPERFSILELQDSSGYFLRSDLGFLWLLDQHYALRSASPYQSIPNNDRKYLPIEMTAFCDSNWVLLWENYQVVGKLLPTSTKAKLVGTSQQNVGFQHGYAMGFTSELTVRKVAEGKWWVYMPVRISRLSPAQRKLGRTIPFRIIEASEQAGRWKFRRLPLPAAEIPLNPKVVNPEYSIWFDGSILQPCPEGFWWASKLSHDLLKVDFEGHIMGSLDLSLPCETDIDTFTYARDRGQNYNFNRFKQRSAQYHGLWVRDWGAARVLWCGPTSSWILLIRGQSGERKDVLLSQEKEFYYGQGRDRIYLAGHRIGNRIAFPYYDIPSLLMDERQ